MAEPARFSFVVPCYNEEPNLRPLLEAFSARMDRKDLELILVDNGSTDGTARELARLLPLYPFARSVRVEINRGYGAGILSGLAAAAGEYAGWIHADLQFSPAAAFEAAGLAERSGGEKLFIKGLRRGRPFTDRLFTGAMALFESLLFGGRLRDVNGQPTLFHRSLLGTWASPPLDFTLDLYASVTAVRAGFRVARFEVENAPRRRGASSWNRGLASRLRLAAATAVSSLRLRAALPRRPSA
jgi:glycosyltransferase involved in cell wall biosynthesis